MKKELRITKTNNRIHTLSNIASLLFFSAFVLLVFTSYLNITRVKLIGFLVLAVPFSLYYVFEKGSLALEGGIPAKPNKTGKWLYIMLSCYLFFNILAGVFSPYRNYANGQGQSVILFGHGRYDGLLILILCLLIFLIFSIEGGFSLIHTNILTITTFIAVAIGFIQMLGVNIFYPYGNFYNYKGIFISTMGNIGVMSTYLIIAFSVVAFSYIAFESTKIIRAFWLVVTALTVAFLIEINVDTGRLAVALLLCIALPILSLNKTSFVKLLSVLSSAGIGCAISSALVFTDKNGLSVRASKMFFVCLILSLILFAVRIIVNKYLPESKLKILFIAIIVIEVLSVIALLLYLKFGGGFNSKTFIELNNILNGKIKDSYGSNRIGLWKYTLLLSFKRLPIGFGTGSFRIGFAEFLKGISKKLSNNTYDFAHNEYIQILYDCGIFGLLSYLGLVVTPVIKGIKKLYSNPKIIVLTFAVMGYLIQAFFTFSIVIISPLFWVILGMLWYEIKVNV